MSEYRQSEPRVTLCRITPRENCSSTLARDNMAEGRE